MSEMLSLVWDVGTLCIHGVVRFTMAHCFSHSDILLSQVGNLTWGQGAQDKNSTSSKTKVQRQEERQSFLYIESTEYSKRQNTL